MIGKWDKRFMEMAKLVSSWSKDRSTKCGAVIVDDKNRIVSTGFNGFPTGFPDKDEDYENRDRKYNLIVHSEQNAILFANKSLDNCTMYCFPMCPCVRCMTIICQTGISRVVFPKLCDDLKERWSESEKLTMELIEECGIKYLELQAMDGEI